ncbi:hypothetical protein Mapa_001215 [Marchantia paleacea]|nr:hypothetical protein Mapa_001215 [Marchantia paleacea]
MFDGVKRTLIHVRFIPKMKKNIISLGMLDSKGLEWSSKQGVLEVRIGDKIILRRHKHKNLYVLHGNTICGEVNLTRSRHEMANVWHSRMEQVLDLPSR